MAGWNGSGTFTRTYNWTDDKTNGIKILASRHDQNDTDFVNGINNCITKDGQNSATANLPMATFKHTNVAAASALTDYLRADQAITNALTYYTATGTDTYAITPNPAITAYAAGQSFLVIFTNANTGAATLNVNALGAKAIEDRAGNALVAGDIAAGSIVRCDYDGTNFQISQVVTITAFAKTLLDDTTASAARTTLGLGSAAIVNTTDIIHAKMKVAGASGAVIKSSGVTSVVRNSTGNYTVTLSSATPDANAALAICGDSSGTAVTVTAKQTSTTSITVWAHDAAGLAADPTFWHLTVLP